MRISLNWLKDFITLTEGEEQIGQILTDTGLEVEKIEHFSNQSVSLEGLVVGEVKECVKHPDADKLKVTKVDIGESELKQIVCGAPNVAVGQKVIVATVNTTLYPTGGEPFKIKKSKIRGEVSEGMICASDEIGMGDDHSGIMVLKTDLANGTPAAEYFSFYNDVVYEIGLTPNRGDAASHIGTARDLKAVLHRELKFPSVEAFKISETGKGPEIIVENSAACPRYSGLTLEGVTVGESPQWLKNRLSAIGVKSINNIVDITNYVLHETGQPLHAFDADKIKGNKVIVKNLPQNTLFTTLDETERKLQSFDLMICNEEGGMCIAGVFGGITSGVKNNTTRIFLESAYFSADAVRKTSQHHGLKTDAAFRYERGCDPEMTIYALKRAAVLMCEIAGAKIVSDIVDIYPSKISIEPVPVKYKNIDRLIGISIARQEIHRILNALDIETEEITEVGFVAKVPAYRVDVTREADVIEEILRIYGFNKIELGTQNSSDYLAEFPLVNEGELVKNLSRYLISQGFYEVMNNSLTKPEYTSLDTSLKSEDDVVVLNKLSEDLGVMRQRLAFQLLEVVSYNQSHKQKNLKFFEFGKTYHKKENKYKENRWLGAVIAGDYVQRSWIETGRAGTFFDLSNHLLKMFQMITSGEVGTSPGEGGIYDYSLNYTVNNRLVASVGKINKKAASKLEVKGEVFYAEINIDQLFKTYTAKLQYSEVSKFPEVKRDLSLVIDKTISFDQIRSIAEKNIGYLLKKIEVFDVYEGDKIEKSQKAYAISFFLQDKEKTLVDKVIDKTMSKLMNAYKEQIGAIIRE